LRRYFCGGPRFVFAEIGESGGFLASNAAHAVAVGTAFVAKEDRTGLLSGFALVPEGVDGTNERDQEGCEEGTVRGNSNLDHKKIFSWVRQSGVHL
jgi:hypothetical protein